MAESGSLCAICSKIDFARYFSSKVGTNVPRSWLADLNLRLGSLADIAEKSSTCDFCYLVVEALTLRWSRSGTPSERRNAVATATDKAGEPARCLLFSFVTGRSWLNPTLRKSYNIGLNTNRHDANTASPSLVWSMTEGTIALLHTDAEKMGWEPTGNGRLVPPLLDSGLMRGWLREYESRHASETQSELQGPEPCHLEEGQDIEGLLVVDVVAMRVVEAPKPCRFLALSYCWGKDPVFRLLKSNREAMGADGSLHAVWDQVPATLRDAITLCRDLETQYIWVDSMCIIQDDDGHRSAQIAQMTRIFQSAILTIVCTDGTHANAGLPGVGAPRSSVPASRIVKGLTMAVPLLDVNETVEVSAWNTRAWTYQERFFSHRLLCVTPSQAFFICGERIFCEDTVLEGSEPDWHHNIVHHRPAGRPRGLYGRIDAVFPLTPYKYHLQEYTGRAITYQSDIVDAFRGVTAMMGTFLGPRSWQGLPERYLAAALLWTKTTGTSGRREGFPSWSWSGWMGKADAPLGGDFEIGGYYADFQSAVEWYLMNDDGDVLRLECQDVVRRFPETRELPEYFGRSIGISRSLPPTVLPKLLPIRDASREAGLSWRNPRFLLGWMRVAVLSMRREDPPISNPDSVVLWPSKETSFCVLGRDQRAIGRVVLDGCPNELTSLGLAAASGIQRCSFALLSRTWWPAKCATMAHGKLLETVTGHSGPWPLVHGLLINVGPNGTAERIGIGFVHEQEWEAVESEEVFLTLK
ncbi:heterokaryon incompatibility protein-domain-containing protein [Podospora conica]|nr:heterokaryon incompatibility protein-domain-containing protein [Schizothecium conicum]